jgi:hypothetical protein
MSEETTTEVTQEAVEQAPENQNVNISVDQILAAILHTIGSVTIKVEDLVANYGAKTIKVEQFEDGSVKFDLTDLPVQEEVAIEAEQASK